MKFFKYNKNECENMNELQEIINPLLNWYQQNKRELPWRENKNPYYIWISEIMLQQTRVEAVKPYFIRFIKEVPTIEILAHIDDNKLLKLWEGLGYYSRAKNLKKCAIKLKENKYQLPNTYEELLKLPGIGFYTAAAIASIGYNQKIAAVDGNVLRVTTRLLNSKINISLDKNKKEIQSILTHIIPEKSGDFNQAMMELGATICIPNPRCNICPLKDLCMGYKTGNMWMLPIKNEKIKKSVENNHIIIYFCGKEFAIEKRPSKGLLSSLYGFPIDNNISVDNKIYLGEYSHTFTHKIWNNKVYMIKCNKKNNKYIWTTLEDIKKYSIPTAFKPCIEMIKTQE